MSTSNALRDIFAAGRPLVEEWLDVAEQIAALRDAATEKGLDWSQVKALLKAQIQDERDGSGEGKRVKRIVEKAEFASAYADMLGLANMNENNFSVSQSYAEAKGRNEVPGNSGQLDAGPETGEITEQPKVETHDAEACNPASESVDPASILTDGQANTESDDVDRSAERASSAVEVGATNSNPQEPNSSPVKADSPTHTSSHASGTYSKPINPDCLKATRGEPCFLSHSMASCSACAAAKARAA